ncbi:MAG: Pyruvate, phosphate dikinase [Candidatus Pacebacteria bacterium GW2011_GWB1_47_8]|nr:MAG: Pyruvate, phosphate dikinase [Candidatus Pacebacteria bacterium GW2011_GWA1_46_10]KKU84320.1 MAG: Pyruvate, phosphate dikinase [Candidatus Pacebacteria bacterium GW2011_GWB1_47_8]
MFGSIVMGIEDDVFESILKQYKAEHSFTSDTELVGEDWRVIAALFETAYRDRVGNPFPQNPLIQLKAAIKAVFESWNGKRAVDYRDAAGIAHDLCTAANVQAMVYGNTGEDSGTGVLFTRDPATGEKILYGDFLINAQGEDVVAGIRNTRKIAEMETVWPTAYQQLVAVCDRLEYHYQDMQDTEFTVENGTLWMLQTRNGKRTAAAAIKIAVDMASEGLITRQLAVQRVTTDQVDALLHPRFNEPVLQEAKTAGRFFASGVNASPGAAVGQVFFDADTAEQKMKEGLAVIMVRPFTRPDDVHGMLASQGILTSEGGATSHAAVVARQFGKPAVVGASKIAIDLPNRLMTAGELTVKEGDWLSIDGATGEVYVGEIETIQPRIEDQQDLLTLLSWADDLTATNNGLQVWANADGGEDSSRARAYGAVGVGLARTEHMFFDPERLPVMQRMILAETVEERRAALAELLPFQRSNFRALFTEMTGLPVVIRLIDPPLHEFLPNIDELPEDSPLKAKAELLHESNPMMGMRGVRLSIVMPEIVEMQVRAIFEAACDTKAVGLEPVVEVMIPLTAHVNELRAIQPQLQQVAEAVMTERGMSFPYKFGTMIEIPRAALTAGEIAKVAEFFSFGTNDLTQMTYGFSRDDVESSFLPIYVEQGILPQNPFQTIDKDGVGSLMLLAVQAGRSARPSLEVGICGEHGGDPESIWICHRISLNYVSCSPFRVPVARLAAAQAAIAEPRKQ